MKYFFLILTFALTTIAEEQRIVCLGDSLTAGYGVLESEAWPALLQNKLDAEKASAKVINAGSSGSTSAGGMSKVKWLFKKDVDVLILALGANDGLRGLSTEMLEKNLQSIIDYCKEKKPSIRIIIAGMKTPPNMGQDYATSFEKVYPKLAEKNKIELIPFMLEEVAGHAKMNLPDGIHPNPEGHKIICQLVWDILKAKPSQSSPSK
ncbi:lipase/acylhydrolase domain protein [Lentisphaera araneosa HTCC2155]|uniref:Lipase/acylhydrolase domain protein n=1 Tax=Lentisphaera araneosa HTCC2155 TaxID=313628 RepID=A6DST7_9BACT|nr:arylesterase [Lentisphaera araneosa]EDM25340.1 lipase/acylhydrolase domain protein [Lentisphaera araneosa HTCC2155]